jgi:hypothetical protein
LIETFTSPPLPTLPETGPPEILPSATFTVEVVCASQLPVFVTTVTCQRPSYGDWAEAGAVAIAAAEARNEANKMSLMRLARMDQIPEMCVMTRLIWSQCGQTGVRRSTVKCSCELKHIKVNPVPAGERWNLQLLALIRHKKTS